MLFFSVRISNSARSTPRNAHYQPPTEPVYFVFYSKMKWLVVYEQQPSSFKKGGTFFIP